MTDINSPQPTRLVLHKISRTLEIEFSNAERFVVPCFYFRVYSPSAESKQETRSIEELLQAKASVTILAIEPVGHYAVKLIFSDGHKTGIFSWETLYQICQQYATKAV